VGALAICYYREIVIRDSPMERGMHGLAQKLKPVLWRVVRPDVFQSGMGVQRHSFVAARSSGNGAYGNHGNAPSGLICFCAGAMSDDCEGEIILCAY